VRAGVPEVSERDLREAMQRTQAYLTSAAAEQEQRVVVMQKKAVQ
jgi:hypothetical protein